MLFYLLELTSGINYDDLWTTGILMSIIADSSVG